MHSIDVLPNPAIQPRGVVSRQFLARDILSFQSACYWVKALPYGTNSNNEDSLILFEEECGTCTTKHGAIARLAEENQVPVYKNLGFYRLNDDIVTGVNALLSPHCLHFIPQIHCFLSYDSYRVDLTEGNCNGKNQTIEDYDFVIRVSPDISHDEEKRHYLQCLEPYGAIAPELKTVDVATILTLLDACNQQVKYQCSVMASRTLSSVESVGSSGYSL